MVLELGDIVKVNNENNQIHCDVDFKTKGFFSGTYNAIHGKVKGQQGEIGEVTGKWSDQIYFARGKHHGNGELLFDAENATAVKKSVIPDAEQQENESRRLWARVTEGIKKGDQETAQEAKTAIEDKQRELAKKREETGETFQPKYFAIKHGEHRAVFSLPKGSAEEQEAALKQWIFGSEEDAPATEAKEVVSEEHQAQESKEEPAPAPATQATLAPAPAADVVAMERTSSTHSSSAPRKGSTTKPMAIPGTSAPGTPPSQAAAVESIPSSPETGVAGHLSSLFGRKHRKQSHGTHTQVSDDQASSRQLKSPTSLAR